MVALALSAHPVWALEDMVAHSPYCPPELRKSLFLGQSSSIDPTIKLMPFLSRTPLPDLSGASVILQVRVVSVLEGVLRPISKPDQTKTSPFASARVLKSLRGDFQGARVLLSVLGSDCVERLRVGDTGIVAGRIVTSDGGGPPRLEPFATKAIDSSNIGAPSNESKH
jgi:hypothetical protein